MQISVEQLKNEAATPESFILKLCTLNCVGKLSTVHICVQIGFEGTFAQIDGI